MVSVVLIVLCLVSKYSCFPAIAVPLVNTQQAPLVAIVDTGKIVEQIMEALDAPVRQLIKKEIDRRLDLIEKLLNETKSQDQSKGLTLETDCTDLLKSGSTSGVYTIYPDRKNGIAAYCDMDTAGGGWTIFQKRIDWQITFNRNWTEFENGFGSAYKEYWLGNKYLHQLTTTAKYEIRIDLSRNGENKYAVYKTFVIGDASSKYRLTADSYCEGNLGEDLIYNSGAPFSTFDQDNDGKKGNNFAKYYGAWWYKSGSGIWLNHDTVESNWVGAVEKKSVMMIRKIQ